MSDSKPNDENENAQQAPPLDGVPEVPARMPEACETAPEATLDVGREVAAPTLEARRRPIEATRKARKRAPAKPRAVRTPATSYTVEAAAELLSLDPTALRARLRRAQRAEGAAMVAYLGGGISGFKLGKSWRLRFPER
jgi:hypothetical protein